MAAPRVTFVDVYPQTYGGAQQVILLLATELAGRGVRIQVVETGRGPFTHRLAAQGIASEVVDLVPALAHYGGTTSGLRAVRAAAAAPRHWWRLARRLRSTTDIVHVGSQRGILLVGPAARLARVGLVWHVHGVRPPQVVNAVGRLLAHRTLAVTPETAAGLPQFRRRLAPVVVPNAVEDRYFKLERAPAEPPFVLTAARLYHDKGIDVLFRAMALVRAARPDVRAVIAGEPPAGHEVHRTELDALRDELELTDGVQMLGFADNLDAWLSAAAVYVQPSRREGFGLAVLEAMAAGVPVVVSDVDGLAQLVEHGTTGLRVRPEDPHELAAAILGLLADTPWAERLARAARGVARERYTVAAAADLVEQVYAEIIEARRRRFPWRRLQRRAPP